MSSNTPRHRYVAARPVPASRLSRLGPRRWAFHRPVRARSTVGTVFRRTLVILLVLFALGLAAIVAFKVWVDVQTTGLIYMPDDSRLPVHHVAMVFGAGLDDSGGPSEMLYDRVVTAADLYKANKVDKLLMTGDNSEVDHNEVEAMRRTAIQLGVNDNDIVLDYAGFNSWDSCYRAREVFGVTEATLVTQRFHLPRALYACNALKVNSVGVVADRQSYSTIYNELREYPALVSTAWRILVNDQPRFLGPKVDIDAPQR
jgi:vancomycin permeability regulator SanA